MRPRIKKNRHRKNRRRHRPTRDLIFKRILAGFIAFIALLIIIPTLIWGVNLYRAHSAQQAGDGQTSSDVIQNKYHSPNGKKKKKVHVKTVSRSFAEKQVREAIPFGFQMIEKTKALPGQTISFGTLSRKETKKLYSLFQNGTSFQQFNDAVNYSSPNGELQWGDAGTTADGVQHTPKPDDPYTLDGGNIELRSSDNENFYYVANIDYHGGDAPKRTAKLKFTVSRVGGVITKVTRIGK